MQYSNCFQAEKKKLSELMNKVYSAEPNTVIYGMANNRITFKYSVFVYL